MILIGAIFLAFCANAHASFDSLDEEGLIPSDGFHDLLGLVPFWMVDGSSVALRRTLGGRYYNHRFADNINTQKHVYTHTYICMYVCVYVCMHI